MLFIKQMTTKVVMLFLFASIFFSCKKGDAGPQGAAGPTGPTGVANVKYSDWFKPDTYTSATVFSMTLFSCDKAAPEITQQVLDSGVVLTYAKLFGYSATIWPAGQVSQLPVSLTYVLTAGSTEDTWSALLTPQKLTIRFVNSDNIYTL